MLDYPENMVFKNVYKNKKFNEIYLDGEELTEHLEIKKLIRKPLDKDYSFNTPGKFLFNNEKFKKFIVDHHIDLDLTDFEKKYWSIDSTPLRLLIGRFHMSYEQMDELIKYLNSRPHDLSKDNNYDHLIKEYLKLTAEAISSNITICPWLKEFDHLIMLPNQNEKVITWDFLPSFYTSQKDLYNNDKYLDTEIFKSGNIKKYYQEVCSSLDELLSQHGYIRENNYYRVEKESEDEIILVCHFGMMSVLMSHLMNIPYVIIANTMCCPPTGITRFVSEERRQGVAHFRCLCFGETPHLVLENYKPSFAARFCETFSSKDRH